MNKLNVLFMGSGEFAIPIFQSLMASPDVLVCGVVTQPDKPAGRGNHVEGGPLKQYIQTLSNFEIPLFQPEKLREDAAAIMDSTLPELIVVAAYGQMVPDIMLNTPKFGAINLHGSLLPKLRGAVPVPMAILQGLAVTGVTIQKMVKALDAGPIYSQTELEILPNDTTESLKLRLAQKGVEMLAELLPKFLAGAAVHVAQDETQATFCYEADIAKEKAEVLYTTPVIVAERMVRAFSPWPVAWFMHDGKRVKIFGAQLFTDELQEITNNRMDLEIVRFGKRLLLVLESGVLELTELQLESKDRRPASEYLFLATRSISPSV